MAIESYFIHCLVSLLDKFYLVTFCSKMLAWVGLALRRQRVGGIDVTHIARENCGVPNTDIGAILRQQPKLPTLSMQ